MRATQLKGVCTTTINKDVQEQDWRNNTADKVLDLHIVDQGLILNTARNDSLNIELGICVEHS